MVHLRSSRTSYELLSHEELVHLGVGFYFHGLTCHPALCVSNTHCESIVVSVVLRGKELTGAASWLPEIRKFVNYGNSEWSSGEG